MHTTHTWKEDDWLQFYDQLLNETRITSMEKFDVFNGLIMHIQSHITPHLGWQVFQNGQFVEAFLCPPCELTPLFHSADCGLGYIHAVHVLTDLVKLSHVLFLLARGLGDNIFHVSLFESLK